MKKEYFEVGQIVNTFTDDLERFEELKSVLVEKGKELIEMQIEEVKYKQTVVLLKLKGIEDMNMAEKLKGCYLKIKREDARKLPNDTYFIADLIGLNVYTEDGILLGKVDDIYNNKSNDIYVIKDELGKQILLPAIKDVIKHIDIENEKITVHLLNGLI